MKKQTIVKKTLILSLICLSLLSCIRDPNGYPRIEDQEQLSPVFNYIEINGKTYIDIDESYCLARVYRISKGYVGATTKAVELNISECNKIIGYAPREYGIFATWLENLRQWLIGLI